MVCINSHFLMMCRDYVLIFKTSIVSVSAENVLARDPTALTHGTEDAICLIPEHNWCIHLSNPTLIHNADAIVVDDRAQAMRNTQQSLPLEALGHSVLDLLVCLEVNRRGSFVADDDTCVSDQRPGESHQLPLA